MGKKILATSLVWFLLILMAASPGGADDIEDGQENGGEVVLNPGYIQGTVSLGDTSQNTVDVDRVEIEATSYDSDNKRLYSESEIDLGNYQLVVHVPNDTLKQNETQEYNISCDIYYSSGYNYYFFFKNRTVNVPFQAPAQTANFVLNPGFISGTVNTDSCDIREGWIYAWSGSTSDDDYFKTKIYFGENGQFHFPVLPGQDIKVKGECTLTNDWTHELAEKTIRVGRGQAVDPDWEIDCGNVCAGTMWGEVRLEGLEAGTVNYHNIRLNGPSDKNIRLEQNGSYRESGLQPGDYSISAYSYLNGYDDFFRFHGYHRRAEIGCNGAVNRDIINQAAFINGAFSFAEATVARFEENQDPENPMVTPTRIRVDATGILETDQSPEAYYSGSSRDWGDASGKFDLVVSRGNWRIYYTEIHFYHNDFKSLCGQQRYVDSRMRIGDYTQSGNYRPMSMSSGQVVNGHDFEFESGAVTFNFSINGDETMEYPELTASCIQRTADGLLEKSIYLDADGTTNEDGTEGQATLIGPPGEYTVTATAMVNGTETTFGEKKVQITAGTCQTFEFGAPKLTVESPEPGLHTTKTEIQVCGKATDDEGISDISVNEQPVNYSYTGNPDDPNEVSFCTTISVQEGQNAITTTATDVRGKSTSDTRTVMGYIGGIFPVTEEGVVKVDYLYDGGLYEGELGIFSLSNMPDLEPGSPEFVQEAVRRVLSDSELGHVVVRDAEEGARFHGDLGSSQEGDFNQGAYKGVKELAMNPQDRIAVVLIPQGSFEEFMENPGTTDPQKRPLFSLATSNPDDAMYYGQIAGINGENSEFLHAVSFEDIAADNSDRDYNDVVVQIRGVTLNSPTLDGLVAEGFLPEENDWRRNQNPLIPHLEVPEPDPDTPWMTIMLKSPADLLVYDPAGRVIGKDGGEIPGASFQWDENGHQVVTLPALDAGEYTVVLRAIGDGGLCHLEVQGYEGDTMMMSQETPLTIEPHQVLKTTVDATSFVDYGEVYFDPPQPPQTNGRILRFDYDGDGDIDESDIARVSELWGICEGDASYDPFYDLDDSGCIDFYDVTAVANAYYAGE